MSINLYLSLYPESLIASMLPPEDFGRYLAVGTTKRESRQEAIYFELDRALCADAFDLPYPQLDNLRKCLIEIGTMKDKPTKTVNRFHPQNLLYRTVNHGFLVGDRRRVLHYPFPAEKELNSTYYDWCRSATQ